MTGVPKVLEFCYNFFISNCRSTTMQLFRFFFGRSRILETEKDFKLSSGIQDNKCYNAIRFTK